MGGGHGVGALHPPRALATGLQPTSRRPGASSRGWKTAEPSVRGWGRCGPWAILSLAWPSPPALQPSLQTPLPPWGRQIKGRSCYLDFRFATNSAFVEVCRVLCCGSEIQITSGNPPCPSHGHSGGGDAGQGLALRRHLAPWKGLGVWVGVLEGEGPMAWTPECAAWSRLGGLK